jgi:hypothetical protein
MPEIDPLFNPLLRRADEQITLSCEKGVLKWSIQLNIILGQDEAAVERLKQLKSLLEEAFDKPKDS